MSETNSNADPKTGKTNGPRMVKVRLPLLPNSDENAVFVSVNNRNYLVKRGENVEVPDFVAEVLAHQEEMLEDIIRKDNARADKSRQQK